MSGNDAGAVLGIHVVVPVDELLFSDMIRLRQRVAVAISVLAVRSDLGLAGREIPKDAHKSGFDDFQACGGDLARDGASQSTLCSERNNRIVSGSLTARPGIYRHEIGLGLVEIKEEFCAGGYIRPCGAKGS